MKYRRTVKEAELTQVQQPDRLQLMVLYLSLLSVGEEMVPHFLIVCVLVQKSVPLLRDGELVRHLIALQSFIFLFLSVLV